MIGVFYCAKPMRTPEQKAKRNIYLKSWRKKNQQKLLIYFQEYRKMHPELKQYYADYHFVVDKYKQRWKSEHNKSYMKEYRKIKREHLRLLKIEWIKKNPEKAKAIELRHRINRHDTKIIADREYRKNNPKKCSEIVCKSKAKNPELYLHIAQQSRLIRRARINGTETEKISILKIYERDCYRCHICLELTNKDNRSIDHLIPVSRNGATTEWNLMLAHLECNRKRGAKNILGLETKESALTYIQQRNELKKLRQINET
jgi:5-methylcytosine-specific restriction endonuclease McrA